MKISNGLKEAVINSDKTLKNWLNAYEYHTDQDKKEEIDFLTKMIPFHYLQTVFVMQMVDKANAIRNVCKRSMIILERDGISKFEFDTFAKKDEL